MRWFLRATALTGIAWALALAASLSRAMPSPEHAPLLVLVGGALLSANLAVALALLVGARNPRANRAAVYAAIFYLLCRMATDLYGVLRVPDPTYALLSLADLLLTVTMATLIIEGLPGALRP